MPGMDGVEATRQLKQASPRTQIIILTSYHQDEHIFPAIKAGALSYLLKDVETSVLVDAVRKGGQRGSCNFIPRLRRVSFKKFTVVKRTLKIHTRNSAVERWMCFSLSPRGKTIAKLQTHWSSVKKRSKATSAIF